MYSYQAMKYFAILLLLLTLSACASEGGPFAYTPMQYDPNSGPFSNR